MKTASLLLSLLLLSAGAMAADEVLLRDDFSAAPAWSAPDKPTTVITQAGGKVRFANNAEDYGAEVTRPLRVPSAAAYRVSFTVTEVSHEGDKTYVGIGLRAPDGDQVGFMLAPEGQVRVNYWHNGDWGPSPLRWTVAPSMKRGAGVANQVTIDREAGRFYVSVNGQLVGATDIVDFMPSQLVLIGNEKIVAEFDDLSVVRTGIDSRIARMLLVAPVPGQAVMMQDDFRRTAKEKLRATTLKKDDRWVIGDSDLRRAAIDHSRELYVLEKKGEGNTQQWAGGDIPVPRAWAGYSVGAKFRFVKPGDGCAGVVVYGHEDKDKEYPMLLGCYHAGTGNAQLWYYPRDNSEWVSLVDVPTTAVRDGMNDLRLVIDGGRMLLFINGEYQGDGAVPGDFEFYGIGLYAEGGAIIEVDDYDAREI